MIDMRGMTHEQKFAEWVRLISQCMESGQPTAEWCRENGVGQGMYRYWLKNVRSSIGPIKDACAALESSGIMPIGGEAEAICPLGGLSPGLARVSLRGPEADAWKGSGAGASAASEPVPAMSIRIGKACLDIYSGADADAIQSALAVLAKIC